MRQFRMFLIGMLFIIAVTPLAAVAQAQDSRTIITLYIPDYLKDQFSDAVFARFEQENPNYKVVIETGEQIYYAPAAYQFEDHLTKAQEYASAADVLWVSSYNISAEATRAGVFLDLRPLINGDTSFDTNDFLPGMLESFSWDNGVWALPAVGDITLIIYDPAKFDAAGVAYPNENWTLDDFANAARTLAVRGTNNEIEIPGFFSFQTSLALRMFTNSSLYDSMSGTVQLTDPSIVQLLESWQEYFKEGIFNGSFEGDYNTVPMRFDGVWALQAPFGADQTQLSGAIPPGGAILQTTGFAVSSGTANPEAAYALAKTLTSDPTVVRALFAASPARRSMIEAVSGEENGSNIMSRLSPENRAVVEAALQNPVPASELLFAEYVNLAFGEMGSNGGDALAALQEQEANANTNLQTATERRSTTVVQVATPVPTPVLNAGEVSLRFGVAQIVSPLPNQEEWETAISEFTATDGTVRQITLETTFPQPLPTMAERFDCFYLPSNAVGEDTSALLNIDPFLDSDPTFDEADYLTGVLNQVQHSDRTWALPVDIQPMVLRYNSELFTERNIPAPTNGWTVDQFADALNQLKTSPDDPEPFKINQFGGTHLLLLIAAYGGMPYDYRTEPPTAQITDPASVEAIRQVLDLARNDYIEYTALFNSSGGMMGGGNSEGIFAEYLNIMSVHSFGDPPPLDPNYPFRFVSFPRGTQYTPLSYDIGALYISAQTPNPDACYRWMSTVAQSPELFGSIPVRRSLLDDETFANLQVSDLSNYFEQLQSTLSDPGLVVIPSPYGGIDSVQDYIAQLFLFRAFDNYVLNDADLEVELENAQVLTSAFQECVANLPPPGTTQEDQQATFESYGECAVQVDPSLESMFGAP
jgi:ABC-type glycerol-3-phosphate transport system substrate-binding protein